MHRKESCMALIEAEVARFDNVRVDSADGLTVHAEATPHVHRALQTIRDRGLRAGLAVNPLTPLGVVEAAIDDIARM